MKKKVQGIATLSEEHRLEYIRRRNALNNAHVMLQAAGAYLDQLHKELQEEYDLPTVYDLDLETGVVKNAQTDRV